MNKSLIAAAAVAALVGGAMPAHATRTITVPYSDLKLESSAGQKALDAQIDRAAKQVCGVGEQRTGTRIRSPEERKCYLAAKAQARERMAAAISAGQKGG